MSDLLKHSLFYLGFSPLKIRPPSFPHLICALPGCVVCFLVVALFLLHLCWTRCDHSRFLSLEDEILDQLWGRIKMRAERCVEISGACCTQYNQNCSMLDFLSPPVRSQIKTS